MITELRSHNRANLLRLLHLNGPTTRARMAADLGLNRSTIKVLVEQLATDGIVAERLPADRVGPGRPSPVVTARGDAVTVLCARFAPGEAVLGLMGIGGHLLARYRWEPRVGEDVPVAEIVHVARRLAGGSQRVDAMGLASTAETCAELAHRFAEELGLPVDAGTNHELAALAEYTRGAGRAAADMVYVSSGAHVGGCALSAATATATGGRFSEFGHMVVHPNGSECSCGCRGCWQTEIGLEAFTRVLALAPGTPCAEVATQLHVLSARPAEACARLADVTEWLTVGLANLINLFGSNVIVLGGLLADLPRELLNRVSADVSARSLVGRQDGGVCVVRSALDADAALAGAAELAFQRALATR